MITETKPIEPTFGSMSAIMILVGFLASYGPGRRASSVDLLEWMRME